MMVHRKLLAVGLATQVLDAFGFATPAISDNGLSGLIVTEIAGTKGIGIEEILGTESLFSTALAFDQTPRDRGVGAKGFGRTKAARQRGQSCCPIPNLYPVNPLFPYNQTNQDPC
jgi:hypothetical protein